MTFGSMDSGGDSAPLAEINMVPLIDVMLVLLIIFIVTAPLFTHAVKVDLPKASSVASSSSTEKNQLAIDAAGNVFWNGAALGADELVNKLSVTAKLMPQPELHILAERFTPYEKVAQVMSEAARQGVVRVALVTDPIQSK